MSGDYSEESTGHDRFYKCAACQDCDGRRGCGAGKEPDGLGRYGLVFEEK